MVAISLLIGETVVPLVKPANTHHETPAYRQRVTIKDGAHDGATHQPAPALALTPKIKVAIIVNERPTHHTLLMAANPPSKPLASQPINQFLRK